LVQVPAQGRGALVICDIGDRRPRGDHAKPLIEGGEFAQERLEGRLTQPSFLGTRRILERLQTVQNQQGSTMRDKLCESLALLPRGSDSWIRVLDAAHAVTSEIHIDSHLIESVWATLGLARDSFATITGNQVTFWRTVWNE
jgi:hypothetical protein